MPLLWIACSQQSPIIDTAAEADPSWTPPVPATPTPEWTAAEVSKRLQSRIDAGLPACMDLVDAWHDVRAMGDADPKGCPGEEDHFEILAGCTAASGYWFSGIAQYTDDAFTDVDGAWRTQNNMVTGFEIHAPDGRTFTSGGGCGITQLQADGHTSVEAWYSGSAVLEWDKGLLAEGVSLLLYTTLSQTTIALDGGVSVGADALTFRHFQWGASCPDGPEGAILLRGEQPYWYTIDFGDDCDHCGMLTHHISTELGEICLDLEPLIADVRDGNAL